MEIKDIKVDILVSGAGPAGLTLSLLLAKAGFEVALIDPEKAPIPSDKPAMSGRTAALLNSSINVLKAADVWPDLQNEGTPLKIMRIVDDSGSAEAASVTFEASDIGQPCFGYNIPNALLRLVLIEQVRKQGNIRYLNPSRLTGYEVDDGRVIAQTDDLKTLHASLIIGTDGRNSIVRKISGIDAKIHDYGQMGITCLIDHTKPHNFTSTEFHRDGGPFTLVPMPGNVSSVVWVEKTDDAKAFLAMKKDEFERAIQDRSKGIVGTIKLKSAPESWPLMMLSSKSLAAPRAVLAAEAAHVLSPIGAQGLNLSLRDVATLAETLTDAARLGEDIGAPLVLSRYEKRRRADIGSRVTGIDGLNRAVANDLSFVKDLRRLGLKSLDKIPALRFLAMNQGLTPSLDQGRILKGEAL